VVEESEREEEGLGSPGESRRAVSGTPPQVVVTLRQEIILNAYHLLGMAEHFALIFFPSHTLVNPAFPCLEQAVAHLRTQNSQTVQAWSTDLSKPQCSHP
jgi:hypothetical protein